MMKYGDYITLGEHTGSSLKVIDYVSIILGLFRDVYGMLMGQKSPA